MDFADLIIGRVANVIQIVTFVFAIVVLLRTHWRLRKYLERVEVESSDRPVALCVGIGQDIAGQVRQSHETQGLDLEIRDYARTGYVPTDKFYLILRDLLKIKQELTEIGVTEVHLYYMGPVALAVAIGSILDNWVPVKIYEYKDGDYQFSFVMEKGTVLGLLEETVSEGEEAVAKSLGV